MSKHAYLGTDPAIPEAYRRFGRDDRPPAAPEASPSD
jgi:hypothetical protein